MLAEYLNNCLENFNQILQKRTKWYDKSEINGKLN